MDAAQPDPTNEYDQVYRHKLKDGVLRAGRADARHKLDKENE